MDPIVIHRRDGSKLGPPSSSVRTMKAPIDRPAQVLSLPRLVFVNAPPLGIFSDKENILDHAGELEEEGQRRPSGGQLVQTPDDLNRLVVSHAGHKLR